MLVAKITYADGTIGWLSPAPNVALEDETETQTLTRISTRDVPQGATFTIVDTSLNPIMPTVPQLLGYAEAKQQAILKAGKTFNVAASGAAAVNVLCDGTNATRADLSMLALYGQQNPSGSKTWVDNNGLATVLTGAQLVTLATLAGNWITETYATIATVSAEIIATPTTITTTAQIDAVTWPAS